MVKEIRHPKIIGIGEKPDTPKPTLTEFLGSVRQNSLSGQKPMTDKPKPPPVSLPSPPAQDLRP